MPLLDITLPLLLFCLLVVLVCSIKIHSEPQVPPNETFGASLIRVFSTPRADLAARG